MVQKNLDIPFTFYCITENPAGLSTGISVIQNDLSHDLDGVWNKLLMFKKDFIPKGTNLYLDIDTIIQHDLTPILNCLSDKLTMVKCYWKDITADQDSWTPTLRNSSILLWNTDQSHIWEEFYKIPEDNMVRFLGIDRWLEYNKISVDYFPEGLIYSRIYGKDFETKNDYSDLIDRAIGVEEFAYHFKECVVCLFNGPVLQDHYKGFEHYWT
jgi:hypothetical protein